MNEFSAPAHGPIGAEHLLERLRWRYSCRKYDSARFIPPDIWAILEETLILTPSSYGLQPWKFFVVTDKEYRKKLYPLSNNQQPVLDASHLVVFTVIDRMLAGDVERWCLRRKELRGARMSEEDFKGMREALAGELLGGSRKEALYEWAAEQAHIALGNFLTSCALLGIDASPMGGIQTQAFDEFLGLKDKRLRTVVLCAAGYRASDEKGTGGAKERFSRSDVIEYLPDSSGC